MVSKIFSDIKTKFLKGKIYFETCNFSITVCLKKNAPPLILQISLQRKTIFTSNFHHFVGNFVGNEMACLNLPGKVSLKLEMKSSRNGAFFNEKFSV
jgi:hypothetical protein